MIAFKHSDLLEVANRRPAGYVDAVLAKARRSGEHVIMDERDYVQIQVEFPKVVSADFLEGFGTEIPVKPIPPNTERRKLPSWDEMISNFSTAAVHWAKSGFKLASPETLAARKEICTGEKSGKPCDFWDKEKYMGSGACLVCGCTTAKLYLATSECPKAKWSKEA